MEHCIICKRTLEKDEIALCKKLLGKKTQQFMCKNDLAEYLNTDVESLDRKIIEFKEEGCTLFL